MTHFASELIYEIGAMAFEVYAGGFCVSCATNDRIEEGGAEGRGECKCFYLLLEGSALHHDLSEVNLRRKEDVVFAKNQEVGVRVAKRRRGCGREDAMSQIEHGAGSEPAELDAFSRERSHFWADSAQQRPLERAKRSCHLGFGYKRRNNICRTPRSVVFDQRSFVHLRTEIIAR
jgi:phage/plasmid primase-like uncharacterized protein